MKAAGAPLLLLLEWYSVNMTLGSTFYQTILQHSVVTYRDQVGLQKWSYYPRNSELRATFKAASCTPPYDGRTGREHKRKGEGNVIARLEKDA